MIRLMGVVAALLIFPTIPALAQQSCQADLNGDGATDQVDAEVFEAVLGTQEGDEDYLAAADFDGNGAVTVTDFSEFLTRLECASGN